MFLVLRHPDAVSPSVVELAVYVSDSAAKSLKQGSKHIPPKPSTAGLENVPESHDWLPNTPFEPPLSAVIEMECGDFCPNNLEDHSHTNRQYHKYHECGAKPGSDSARKWFGDE
jgi:hypothetical protein